MRFVQSAVTTLGKSQNFFIGDFIMAKKDWNKRLETADWVISTMAKPIDCGQIENDKPFIEGYSVIYRWLNMIETYGVFDFCVLKLDNPSCWVFRGNTTDTDVPVLFINSTPETDANIQQYKEIVEKIDKH